MPGFMDSINKGLTTINVKTSNLMETSKLKTSISTKESEIRSLKAYIGDTVYVNRANFSMDMVEEKLSEIERKYSEIEDLKAQIARLDENEKEILGNKNPAGEPVRVFCTKCGAPNDISNAFCEKCGNKLEV